MDAVEQLRQWGLAHGAAREAERAAGQRGDPDLQRRARQLREHADRLHAQAYRALSGGRPGDARPQA